jgi:hypothetical protein
LINREECHKLIEDWWFGPDAPRKPRTEVDEIADIMFEACEAAADKARTELLATFLKIVDEADCDLPTKATVKAYQAAQESVCSLRCNIHNSLVALIDK